MAAKTGGEGRTRGWALAVTIAVPVAVFLAGYVPLPFLDLAAVRGAAHLSDPLGGLLDLPPRTFGVLAVGLMPLVSAYVVVEVAALVVPRWRALRIGGPPGRRKLFRATLVVCAVAAVIQALGLAAYLSTLGIATASRPVLEVTAAGLFVLGTAVMMAAAALVEAKGLIGGVSAVIGGAALAEVVASNAALILSPTAVLGSTGSLVVVGTEAVVVAALTFFLLGNGHRRSGTRRAHVPLPASGLVPPIVAVGSLPALYGEVASWTGAPGLALVPGSTRYRVVYLVLLAAFVVVMSLAFNWPRRVAAVRRRMGRRSPDAADTSDTLMRSAPIQSLLLAAGLVSAMWFAEAHAPPSFHVSPVTLAVATAVVLDVLDGWQARKGGPVVAVWPLHRPYAVPPALDALAEAGIEAHVGGLHHRTLLQFFGPYVPMKVMVPPASADAAVRLLERLALEARVPTAAVTTPVSAGGAR